MLQNIYFAMVALPVCLMLLLASSGIKADPKTAEVVEFTNKEMELYNYLLNKEGKRHTYARPVKNVNDTVEVTFGMKFMQLIKVDPIQGEFVINVWKIQSWMDLSLKWNKTSYDNITSLKVPYNEMWQPDIHLFNSVEFHDLGAPSTKLVVVYNTGHVLWIYPDTLHASCEFNLENFPSDSNTCHIKLGSWTYDNAMITLKTQDDGMAEFEDWFSSHSEWDIDIVGPKKNVVKYDCCTEEYGDITWNVTLTRKSAFYKCVLVSPGVFIAILTPFLFVLNHVHKFPLGAGLLVSLTILLEILNEHVPVAHERVPILAQYFTGLFGLVSLALVLSTVTSNLASKLESNKPPPSIVKKLLVDTLGRLLCVRASDYAVLAPTQQMQALEKNSNIVHDGDSASFAAMDTTDDAFMIKARQTSADRTQWPLVARVLDRIFFIIFIIIALIFSFTAINV